MNIVKINIVVLTIVKPAFVRQTIEEKVIVKVTISYCGAQNFGAN